jgi:hypothetical protein
MATTRASAASSPPTGCPLARPMKTTLADVEVGLFLGLSPRRRRDALSRIDEAPRQRPAERRFAPPHQHDAAPRLDHDVHGEEGGLRRSLAHL